MMMGTANFPPMDFENYQIQARKILATVLREQIDVNELQDFTDGRVFFGGGAIVHLIAHHENVLLTVGTGRAITHLRNHAPNFRVKLLQRALTTESFIHGWVKGNRPVLLV